MPRWLPSETDHCNAMEIIQLLRTASRSHNRKQNAAVTHYLPPPQMDGQEPREVSGIPVQSARSMCKIEQSTLDLDSRRLIPFEQRLDDLEEE
jgi:hypothetical protein